MPAPHSLSATELTTCAEKHLPVALHWLQRMVAINSFTTNIEGIQAVGRLTEECFAGLGFTAESVPATNPAHGPHLFLSRPGRNKEAKPVVLVTHLDTVFPPEEEQSNQFYWKEDGDRIYGPGTVDNKGGTALIWLMLMTLRECLPEVFENTSWLIAANSAEEVIGSDFAQRTTERCPLGARFVLVFEGGPRDAEGWHIVTSRKGRLEYRIHSEGRAAHAGSNHLSGINAVVELGSLLPFVHALNNPEAGLTLNVANIHGGTVLNRVPHEAVAELEMRAFEPQVLAIASRALEEMAGPTRGGARITMEQIGTTQAWPGGAETDRLFEAWQKAGAELGHSVHPMARGGLSDANYLCHLAPTLDAMGPSGGNAHCSEWTEGEGGKRPEYVEPGSYVTKTVMNILALASLAQEET